MSKKESDKKASGIMVYCAHKAIVKASDLNPNPRNPNMHTDTQVELLAKIIRVQGWRNPIVVSDLSGLITKGHCRLASAKLLGLDTVPIDVQHYANESEEMADMVADNRIAELADIDNAVLKDILQDIDTGSFDMDLTGFDGDAMETLMTQYHIEDGRDGDKFGASPWDRVGDASAGVMFAFGAIQCRLGSDDYDLFLSKCPKKRDDIEQWLRGTIEDL